jgi:hypothetical protein
MLFAECREPGRSKVDTIHNSGFYPAYFRSYMPAALFIWVMCSVPERITQ